MEQMEITNKLLNKVEKLGYSEEVKDQIRQAREKGLTEFYAREKRYFNSATNTGGFEVDYQLNFAPGKDEKTTYLQNIEALLSRDIAVAHKTVNGINTRDTEALILQNPLLNGGQQLPDAYVQQLQQQLQWTLQHAPETFAALLVKYNPPVHLDVPENVTQMAVALQASQNKYNIYSSYYNLTALEIANTLHGRQVRKGLFRTTSAEQNSSGIPQNDHEASQKTKENNVARNVDHLSTATDSLTASRNNKENMFRSWLEVDFSRPRRPNGACEINLLGDFDVRQVLKEFQFRELVNMYDRSRVADFIEKGSLVLFNNLSDRGERQVLAQANGTYKGLDLFKLDGEPITNHRTYLKDRHVEVGAYVELKRGRHPEDQQQKKTPESGQERSQRMNDLRNQAIAAGSKAAAQNSGTQHNNYDGKVHTTGQQQNSSVNVRHTVNRKARTVQSDNAHKGQKR